MASNPPGSCCARGHLFSGEPTGKATKLDDGKTEAYIATASGDVGGKKDCALLYVPDIFGIWKNSKLMADQFAAEGYTTLVPDLFNGDQAPVNMPDGFDIMGWLGKGTGGNNPHTTEYIDPIIVLGIKTLQTLGYKKIGAVGYCFGAKYLIRHYKDGIQVGFVAHPSFVDDDELAAITGPLSIAAAETDTIFPKELRHKSEDILIETKQPYQINLFQGVSHGFSVRGDPSIRADKFAKESAFQQAIAWFDEFLAKD